MMRPTAMRSLDTDHDAERLLREFVQTRSEPAFAAIVDRFVDLVFNTARRRLGGRELRRELYARVFDPEQMERWESLAEEYKQNVLEKFGGAPPQLAVDPALSQGGDADS